MYRIIASAIENSLNQKSPPIILILGLRQTGKTTLAKQIMMKSPHQFFNFDLISDQQEFLEQNRHTLQDFARRYEHHVIVIDEVQKCPEAIAVIKHLYDTYKLQFILTGSSELKIKRHIGDSLAGRIKQFRLYPLSIKELLIQRNVIEQTKKPSYDHAQPILSSYLIYGSLPRLENIQPDTYDSYLTDFIDTLLTKDVLEIGRITRSTKLYALTKLLAQQIGQLVNVNELALLTELSRASIYHYLDILEQLNIICRVYPLSTNDRKAISTKCKVYFTDLGMRNALIKNFTPLNARTDSGALLENAVYMGFKRTLDYTATHGYELGFFRNDYGSELDIVLRNQGKESLYEIKSSAKYLNKKGTVTYITMKNAWEYL